MARRNYQDDGSVAFTPSSIPPWQMWGNTQILTLVDTNASDQPQVESRQLIKVAHSRPDTWQWLFHARILEAPTLVTGERGWGRIDIYWDLMTGLGQSAVPLLGFDHFSWYWSLRTSNPPPPDVRAPIGDVQWATSTLSPPLSYGVIGDGTSVPQLDTRRAISQIVGQDIQLAVRASLVTENGRAAGKIEVSAYMTPNCGALPGK